KVDNKANYSQSKNPSVKQRKPLNRGKSATKTKQEEKDVDAEIAQLKEMLSRAQRKRSSTSYRENSDGDSDPNDNGDSTKGLPRNQKSRRSPLAGVLKPKVPVAPTTMIPAAEEATCEEVADMPEASQAQEQIPDERIPDEQIPGEQIPDEQIPGEQNLDGNREEDAQLDEEDTGEQSVKAGQQQTPPVNLKYVL
ncbi:unnamed protein product, partial [Lasius platythorax]